MAACLQRRPSRSSSTWSKATGSGRPNDSPACIVTRSCGWRAWPGGRPRTPTTNWSRFPPESREVQLDERWSFVAKKQHHCDPDAPADDHRGDWWDHVAYDAEHRLVLAVVPGARSIENAEETVQEVYDRTAGRTDMLLTSDAYPAYETAIEHAYGEPEPPKRKTYRFSKDWRMHEAMTNLTMYSYNFCWPVRTLRERTPGGARRKRTPAMAAGLADHVWSLQEWLTFPAVR